MVSFVLRRVFIRYSLLVNTKQESKFGFQIGGTKEHRNDLSLGNRSRGASGVSTMSGRAYMVQKRNVTTGSPLTPHCPAGALIC